MIRPRARLSPGARRSLLYVALVALVAWGLLRQQHTVEQLHDIIDAEEAEERVEDAVRCVASWEVREEIRQSDEDHGLAAGEALIDVVETSDPVLIERYRERLAARLREASDQVSDPTCNLAEAQQIVEGAGSVPTLPPAAPTPLTTQTTEAP